MMSLAEDPVTHSIFEQALRTAGPWAAGLTVVVGLALVFLRAGLMPLLVQREESVKSKRTFDEEREKSRHVREMELEEVRLKRDQANAQGSIATERSMEKAEKIAEMLSSTTETMSQFLPSLIAHHERNGKV